MQGMKSSISKAEYYYSAVEIYIQSVSSNIRYVEGGINTLGFLASVKSRWMYFFFLQFCEKNKGNTLHRALHLKNWNLQMNKNKSGHVTQVDTKTRVGTSRVLYCEVWTYRIKCITLGPVFSHELSPWKQVNVLIFTLMFKYCMNSNSTSTFCQSARNNSTMLPLPSMNKLEFISRHGGWWINSLTIETQRILEI